MSDRDKSNGNDEPYANYEPLESAIDTAQEQLKEAEAGIPESFEADYEDIEDHLEDIEDHVDDAQDARDPDHLGIIPATIDYVQVLAERVAEQTDEVADELEDFAVAMEAVEDRLDHFEVDRSRWFAEVNGVPLLYTERTVEAGQLIEDALDPDDPSNYTLEAYTSAVDEEPDKQFPRPEHEVDLADFDVYRTARDKGGGPV